MGGAHERSEGCRLVSLPCPFVAPPSKSTLSIKEGNNRLRMRADAESRTACCAGVIGPAMVALMFGMRPPSNRSLSSGRDEVNETTRQQKA